MSKAPILLCLVLALSACAEAAFRQPYISPSSVASARTQAATFGSADATASNPAMLRFIDKLSISFGGQRLHSLDELDTYCVQAAYSLRTLSIGAGFQSFGESGLYLESRAGFGAAMDITSELALGLAATYNRVDQPEGYHDLDAVTLAIGSALKAHESIVVHAALANPFEPEIVHGSVIHRELTAGVLITSVERMYLAIEIFARSGDDIRYRIGESYRVSDELRLNAGLMTAPFVPSFGFDIGTHGFRIGYAYSYHSDLGGTHTWGLAYSTQ